MFQINVPGQNHLKQERKKDKDRDTEITTEAGRKTKTDREKDKQAFGERELESRYVIMIKSEAQG